MSQQTVVILVHGGPSLNDYMSSLAKLLPEFKTLTYEQRGNPANPAPLSDISFENHIQDLRRVVEKSPGTRKVLVGHSWGAFLALVYAARYPDSVARVVVIGAAWLEKGIGDQFGQNLMDRLSAAEKAQVDALEESFQKAQTTQEKNELRQKRLDVVCRHYNFDSRGLPELPEMKWNYETFLKLYLEVTPMVDSGEVANILKTIRVPVVAFHGEEDPIPCVATGEFLKKHVPNLSFESVPRAGHFPWVEPKAQMAFLSKLKTALR